MNTHGYAAFASGICCRTCVLPTRSPQFHALRAIGFSKGQELFVTIEAVSSARHEGRASRIDYRNTVAIAPQRVDALSSSSRNTVAIAVGGKLVARIGGAAEKGAAELPVATDRREC